MSQSQTPSLLHVFFDLPRGTLLSDAFRRSGLSVTDIFTDENDTSLDKSFDYIVITALPHKNDDKTDVIKSLIEKVSEYLKRESSKVLFLIPQGSAHLDIIRQFCPTAGVLLVDQKEPYVDGPTFAREVERNLFSLRAYGQEELIRGVDLGEMANDKPKERKLPKLKEKLKEVLPKRKKKRFIVSSLIALLLVIIAPYLLAMSALMLTVYVARHTSNKLLTFLANTNKFSESVAYMYVQNGGIFSVYNDALGVTRMSQGLIKAAQEETETREIMRSVAKHLASEDTFSVSDAASQLTFAFDGIYSNLGFSLTELEEITWMRVIANAVDKKSIEEKRQNLLMYRGLAKNLPELLGVTTPKTYAFVLQNEEVVRPTGGRIEVVALVTVNDGRIEEIETFSMTESDKKLSGTITAPLPISKYAKRENWSLRDANWDYSFPASAERIAWFIDKEFDRKVDGVIAISKGVLQREEIEERDGLEKGIRELFDSLGDMKSSGFSVLIDALSKKELLFSIPAIQTTLAELNWNGDIPQAMCEGNCLSDIIGIVESNFGDRADIRREAEVKTSIEEGVEKTKLTYYIKNTTDKTYKTYTRVFTKGDAGFSPVTILKVDGNASIDPEVYGVRGMKEAGVYIEIPAGKTFGLEYSWESAEEVTLDANGSYELSFFKQPGVDPFPLSIQVTLPLSSAFSVESSGFLTKGDSFAYNSVLTRNLSKRIEWEK